MKRKINFFKRKIIGPSEVAEEPCNTCGSGEVAEEAGITCGSGQVAEEAGITCGGGEVAEKAGITCGMQSILYCMQLWHNITPEE